MHNVTKRPTRPQGPSGTPGAPGPSGPFRIPVLPGLVAVSVLVVIASLVSLISFTTHAERTPAVKPDAAAHAPVRARAADSPTAAAAAATAAAPATAAEGAPSATSADAPDAASPASQAGAAVQHGERANELYGSREVRWSRSTPFALVFWDERAQDINLGSTRNFIKWLNENFGQTVNASLVRCHAGSDCDARLAPADGIGIVGSIADRNKAELGSNRMGYVRTHALLKSKLLFLSMTGDEYCQLKSHQNVDLVFRNYWDAPYMGAYGAHLPGGHAAWMPMGKGHAMPEVEPLELQGKPGPSRKYLFNLVVSLNTHKDRKRLQAVVTNMSSALKTPKLPWFVHYTKHWSPLYDPGHKYLPPAEWKQVLLDSLYTLVPSGKNLECFRMWEALEAGSIPIVANRLQPQCGDSWVPFREAGTKVVFLDDWAELPAFVGRVFASDAALAQVHDHQRELVAWYKGFKTRHYTKLLNLLIRAYEAKTSAT